ncbi:MAG TPA: MoxR family ATPase [Thermoanaerobaculia bacterium]|nr:MoxR family ATPase [Thermoanaerobaculia bacterium]
MRREALTRRELPATLSSHREAARHYRPDAALVDAVNVALAVGVPLLLTGEPGTGKTQVAHYLAWYFDLEGSFFPLYVRSNTTAEDLIYRFDAVAYLHAANDPGRRGKPVERSEFIQKGPLWKAYETGGPTVVLIDEIDKAPRDFPNDLLNVLDQHTFEVPEIGSAVSRGTALPPVVVITSNSERRLPEPFLRRCIFHHIELTEELIRRAVEARVDDFPNLPGLVREAALQRFFEIRGREVRKRPATAELLVWLTVLAARGNVSVAEIADCRLSDLPAVTALVKDRDDLALLG